MKESVYIKPVSVACYNYTWQGKIEKRTVVIAPIRFRNLSNGSIEIGWACSVGASCEDNGCRYAKGREKVLEDKVVEELRI